jgi:hypothetical protein
LTGGLDSAHLKPGKEIWVRVIDGEVFKNCALDQDAVLYGHVMSASSSKDTSGAELSLLFDHGDCNGHTKQPLRLRLIGVIGPPSDSRHMHGELPTEVSGGVRSVSTAIVGNLVNAYDEDLNPGGAPHTVEPGIVLNMPSLKLEPEKGPACSTRLVSNAHSVTLGVGSQLILAMMVPAGE